MKKSNKDLREQRAKDQIRIANQGERKMWVKAPSIHAAKKGHYDRKRTKKETKEIINERW